MENETTSKLCFTLHALLPFHQVRLPQHASSPVSKGICTAAAEHDLSLQIFGLMNLIIDRLGDSVKPFAEGLLRLLPEVWQDAEGQSLLRIQVTLAQRPCLLSA